MGHPGSGPYNPPKSGSSTIIIVVVAVVVLGLIMIPIMAAILFPVFARSRGKAQETVCMTHMLQLGVAMSAYQTNWGDTYPPSGEWNGRLATYVKDPANFQCPSAKSSMPGYAMNSGLSGIPGTGVKYPGATVMFFETAPGDNKAGGPALLLSRPRHMRRHTTCFADGRAKMIEQSAAGALNWEPAPKTAPTLPTRP